MDTNSYVPCLAWVKRGATKSQLEKVKHTKEELLEIIKEMKLKEAEYTGRPKPKSTDEDDDRNSSDSDDHDDVDDYYNMDDYDDDAGDVVSGIDQGVEHLLLSNVPESDSEDSEAEPDEFTVKPEDNLILVGHIDKDVPMLEVMVFNHEKAEFFILQDIMLPSFPFAIEWLDFNPKDGENFGSFAAVGGINPEIDVWDLNVSGSLEPAFRLGSTKKKSQRHSDAVLDLSWNGLTRNVLASGSADHTVMLWDMAQNLCVKKLTPFEEKVQSLKWHSSESQNLLVGSCDGKVRLFDCRNPSVFKTWIFDGEIERVLWSEADPMHYYATSEKGMVYLVDIRQTKPLWNLKAHEKEVTGITIGKYCPDLLVTSSMDETVKVWDIKDGKPEMICQKFMNIGPIFTLTNCPDVPYVFCAGGSKKDNYLYLWDSRDNEAVSNRFVKTGRIFPKAAGQGNQTMELEQDPQPCSSSSLASVENNLGGRIQRQPRENKKSKSTKQPKTAALDSKKKKKTKKSDHKNLHPKTPKDNNNSSEK